MRRPAELRNRPVSLIAIGAYERPAADPTIFNDSDRLFGPMMEPLRDPARFAEVQVDELGVICWPNGADLAPDALYERLKTGAAGAR